MLTPDPGHPVVKLMRTTLWDRVETGEFLVVGW